jgi:hypothetical protein
MKIWLLVVVLVVSGIVTGIGSAVFRVRSSGWDSESLNSPLPSGVSRAPAEKVAGTGPPVAVIDSDVHDFGVMEASKNGTHDFVISNDGESELELTGGGTTCKCTLSKISKRKIPPGESSTVTVDWKGKNNAGEFRHTATILTNDGHNPKIVLTIEGRMTGIFRSSPQELTFSRVSAGESVVGNVKLFSYVDKPLEISEHRVSDPEHLEVSIAPLSEGWCCGGMSRTTWHWISVDLERGISRLLDVFTKRMLTSDAVDCPMGRNRGGRWARRSPCAWRLTAIVSRLAAVWMARRGIAPVTRLSLWLMRCRWASTPSG